MKSRQINNGAENAQNSKLCLISIEISKGVMSYLFFRLSINPANGQAKKRHVLIVNVIRSIYLARIILNGPALQSINVHSAAMTLPKMISLIKRSPKISLNRKQWRTYANKKKELCMPNRCVRLCDKLNSEVALAIMVSSFEFHLFSALLVGEFIFIANYGV